MFVLDLIGVRVILIAVCCFGALLFCLIYLLLFLDLFVLVELVKLCVFGCFDELFICLVFVLC